MSWLGDDKSYGGYYASMVLDNHVSFLLSGEHFVRDRLYHAYVIVWGNVVVKCLVMFTALSA